MSSRLYNLWFFANSDTNLTKRKVENSNVNPLDMHYLYEEGVIHFSMDMHHERVALHPPHTSIKKVRM
jgi:hypothetical protein